MSADNTFPSDGEYKKRFGFLKSCCKKFIEQKISDGKMRIFIPDNAPKALADAYARQVNWTRMELAPLEKEGGNRHRIDRHKIAAAMIKAIHEIQPVRRIGTRQLCSESNAYLCLFTLAALFERWYLGTGKKFQLNDAAKRFLKEHRKWLMLHQEEVPHQLLSQAYYLLEWGCLVELEFTRAACGKIPCDKRQYERLAINIP